MMTVDQIMDELGGFAKIADATGIPPSTVHSWKRSGFIPEWRRPALVALAKKAKKPLSLQDFPEKPARTANAA